MYVAAVYTLRITALYHISRYPADIQRGIVLLEELYKRPEESGNRDFIYYLAIGNARLKVNHLVIYKYSSSFNIASSM